MVDWFEMGNPEVSQAKMESMRLCALYVKAHSDLLAAAFENDDAGLAGCVMTSLYGFAKGSGLGSRTVMMLCAEAFGDDAVSVLEGVEEALPRFNEAINDRLSAERGGCME